MKDFGALEARLMASVWSSGAPATVHEIVDRLDGDPVAYTTAITVLERLRTKGWLGRRRDGRAFRYAATYTEDEYAARLMSEALTRSHDRGAALLSFAGDLDASDAERLRAALDRAQRPR